MTNNIDPTAPGIPAQYQPQLSEAEAVDVAHQAGRPELASFAAALGMQHPVSTEKMGFLLEHLIREQMTTDATTIAAQMRNDHWDRALADGETLEALAQRAQAFLRTHEGIALFNFFAKTFAKTSNTIF